MAVTVDLESLEFLAPLPVWALDSLAASAEQRSFEQGDCITRQHDKARYAFFLQHGRVQVLLSLQGHDDLVIETLTESDPMLGWSVFRPPYRYTATIRCETPCDTIAIPRTAFDQLVEQDPTLEPLLLRSASVVVAERLERTQDVLTGRTPGVPQQLTRLHEADSESDREAVTAGDRLVLARSPFFEPCTAVEQSLLADQASTHSFPAGARLFRRGDDADVLHMVVDGRVQLTLDDESPPSMSPSSQTIGEAGRIVGWSSLVAPYHYRAGAVALTRCRTVAFQRSHLTAMMEKSPDFATRVMHQVLAVLGNRLRETRMWMIARRYGDELAAIRSLIDQHAEALSVASPLHKLPLFLENRITMPDAFQAMQLLSVHGDDLERALAGSCLDLMMSMQREADIYHRLQAIYQHVATADPDTTPRDVRARCSEEFEKLFEGLHYEVRGLDRLPAEPGNLFIMNHLTNDDENLLPNGFRLTMDTHFVSAMIVYRTYGEAPIRVIRKSTYDEYGHQMYYDRLDYIYVYRAHLDPIDLAEESDTLARRRDFLDEASSRLARGENIVICPEGDCTFTESSPLPLRSGVFRLARYADPEPLIVPITVANFDKRLARTTLTAVVHEPFRLSAQLDPSAGDTELFAWMTEFQETFSRYVAEARELAQNASVRQGSTGSKGAVQGGPSAWE